jgi:hypothetical protein
VLGACLALVWHAGALTAQVAVETLVARSRTYFGCYELRLIDWSSPEGRSAAESIPDRIWLLSAPAPVPAGAAASTASVVSLDFLLGPAPSYGPSIYVDERWSVGSAADSIVLSWSSPPLAGVRAVLAVSGSAGQWRLTGRTAAWNGDSSWRGRAAGRTVECER